MYKQKISDQTGPELQDCSRTLIEFFTAALRRTFSTYQV